VAQDDNGNIWLFGEYPELYSDGKAQGAPSAWIAGVSDAKEDIFTLGAPTAGSPSFSEGTAIRVGFEDRGQVFQMGQTRTVPLATYSNIMVIDEWAVTDPGSSHQCKYYAPGVGDVYTAPAGGTAQESLALTSLVDLDLTALAAARATVLQEDLRATAANKLYGQTAPAVPRPGVVTASHVATGHIVGNGCGSFANYMLYYPGDESVGTLTLSLTPANPVTDAVVGINIYQGGSFIATSPAPTTPGVHSATFSSTTAGPVLVHVGDYGDGVAADYQLQLAGVNQAVLTPVMPVGTPPAPVGVSPVPTNSATGGDGSSAKSYAFNGNVTGTLPGNAAGNFVYYSLPFGGDGSTQTIEIDFAPGGREASAGIFLTLFQNGAQLTTVQAAENQENPPGILPLSYSSMTAGPDLIQIGNHNPSTTISYTLGPSVLKSQRPKRRG
jgi:hypothetical protein